MDFLISVFGSLIPFILLLGIIIAIHELGHYAAGRLFGAAIESYALGFGRSIFETTDRHGTRWRINWLPLGGFVKFVDGEETPSDTDKPVSVAKPHGLSYPELPPWQRAIIAIAGPLANFVLAAGIFMVLAFAQGIEIQKPVEIVSVLDGEPAYRAGILPGDKITAIDGRLVRTPSDVVSATRFHSGETLVYQIERGGQLLDIPITPERKRINNEVMDQSESVGRIGLQMRGHDVEKPGLLAGVWHGIRFTGDLIRLTNTVIMRIVSLKEPTEHLRGPVGIWEVSDQITDMHMQSEQTFTQRLKGAIVSLIFLAGLLSVGVGYFNLLPLPILDGGHIVGCLVEMVSRREISESLRQWGMSFGLTALGSFFILVTWQDLKRVGLFDFFGRFLS